MLTEIATSCNDFSMDSFQKIIDAFGTDRLAEAAGVTESHVRVMRARDSIPPLYWPDIVAKAPDHLKGKVTFDLLKTLRAGRFAAAPASAIATSDPFLNVAQ